MTHPATKRLVKSFAEIQEAMTKAWSDEARQAAAEARAAAEHHSRMASEHREKATTADTKPKERITPRTAESYSASDQDMHYTAGDSHTIMAKKYLDAADAYDKGDTAKAKGIMKDIRDDYRMDMIPKGEGYNPKRGKK